MLLGASPLRLSFAGGGTDLREYYENFEGVLYQQQLTILHM